MARAGDFHCISKRCQPKVDHSGQAYVIVCGSGGMLASRNDGRVGSCPGVGQGAGDKCGKRTRWKGTGARDINRFKLWYSRGAAGKNEIGILVDRDLREMVVDVRRVNDRVMTIKLVVSGVTFNVISAYAPQVGLGEEVKRRFWDDLDEVVRGIPYS
ncbi:PREDICTED: uncharacterized protein LOC109226041 [Nicotiana attenuata]|uniref:uncharacterized protein LOC109226041 n=1 Tax=Nicotiana attenuata TaxID=49451 RepID=UPI000904FC4B|nr:PREDICTED: uncharacterized protein LOC109226041 [Nicotiana attenuata]